MSRVKNSFLMIYRKLGRMDRRVSDKIQEAENNCQKLENILAFYLQKLNQISLQMENKKPNKNKKSLF